MSSRQLKSLLLVVFLVGLAGTSFFVANKLSTQSGITPNAPDSNPLASEEREIGRSVPKAQPKTPVVKTVPKTSGGRGDNSDYNEKRSAAAKATQKVTPKTTPPAKSGGNNNNNSGDNSTPNTTTAPKNGEFGHVAQPGEYGYNADPSKNLVSGMYRTASGELRVVGVQSSQKAAEKYFGEVQNKVGSLTTKEILEQSNLTTKYNSCKSDTTCLANVLNEANSSILAKNNVPKEYEQTIKETIKQAQINDAIRLITYSPEEAEKILHLQIKDKGISAIRKAIETLGVKPEESLKMAIQIDNQQKAQSKYFDLNISTAKLAEDTCKKTNFVSKNSKEKMF